MGCGHMVLRMCPFGNRCRSSTLDESASIGSEQSREIVFTEGRAFCCQRKTVPINYCQAKISSESTQFSFLEIELLEDKFVSKDEEGSKRNALNRLQQKNISQRSDLNLEFRDLIQLKAIRAEFLSPNNLCNNHFIID